MNRIKYIFNALILTSFMMLASCGSDNALSGSKNGNATNPLAGNQCGCDSTYSPVCGNNNNVTYNNSCLARCYNVKSTTTGNCICSEALRVCGIDGAEYSECEARYYHIAITKFAPCRSKTL